MPGMPGRSGGPRINSGRPRKADTMPARSSYERESSAGPRRKIEPLEYLQDVLSDPTVQPARRDRIAIAMLGVLLRHGGLGKKAMLERAATDYDVDRDSHWWDHEAGCSLLDPRHGERRRKVCQEVEKPGEEEPLRRSWDELLAPRSGAGGRNSRQRRGGRGERGRTPSRTFPYGTINRSRPALLPDAC